jgi:hypothetical protein
MPNTKVDNDVLQDVLISGETAQALLLVDQTHPFYFDHPLDHVPGLLLIEAMVQLSRQLASLGPRPQSMTLGRLDAEFMRFCIFDHPVRLVGHRYRMTGAGAYAENVVEVWQQNLLRARAACEWVPAASLERRPIAADSCPDGGTVLPCDASLVRKHRRENVMIGVPREAGSTLLTPVLSPHPDNCLFRGRPDDYSAVHLLEAFMQTQRFLNMRSGVDGAAAPARMRDTLVGLSIRMLKRVGIGSAPTIVRELGGIAAVKTGRRTQRGVVCHHLTAGAWAPGSADVVAECALHSVTAV